MPSIFPQGGPGWWNVMMPSLFPTRIRRGRDHAQYFPRWTRSWYDMMAQRFPGGTRSGDEMMPAIPLEDSVLWVCVTNGER